MDVCDYCGDREARYVIRDDEQGVPTTVLCVACYREAGGTAIEKEPPMSATGDWDLWRDVDMGHHADND